MLLEVFRLPLWGQKTNNGVLKDNTRALTYPRRFVFNSKKKHRFLMQFIVANACASNGVMWLKSRPGVKMKEELVLDAIGLSKTIDYSNCEVFGRATSKWVVMNEDTRRLQKVNDDVIDEYLVFYPKTPRLGRVPRRADIDMNKHINIVTYFGWVFEMYQGKKIKDKAKDHGNSDRPHSLILVPVRLGMNKLPSGMIVLTEEPNESRKRL